MDQIPTSTSSGWLTLRPHPDGAAGTGRIAVEARVVQTAGRQLRFEYRAGARPASAQGSLCLRLPRGTVPGADARQSMDGRAANLWRETCCEAFLRVGEERGYLEFNFAPSGRWAAYEFSAYRAGMRELAIRAPRIACQTHPTTPGTADRELVGGFDLQATVELPESLARDQTRVGRLDCALTAVLQLGRERLTTHWSLCHPPGRADFHDPANFALPLPAPAAARS